jgi:hypothetical protein
LTVLPSADDQTSEYTDKIDVIGFGLSKAKRIVNQIKELCAIMSGLVVASDYSVGQELFSGMLTYYAPVAIFLTSPLRP